MSGTLLAFDLGAESGRGILGRFDGNRLTLEQIHRFENGGVALLDRLYWDPLRLFGEIEAGLKLTASEIGKAEERRTAYYQRMQVFMDTYEFMVMPVNQVLPFDVTTEYPTEINGIQMETYIDWMKSCYYISTLGHPAVSVPCGFTDGGLPVGLQIVGRHHDDLGVLQLANAFEQITGVGAKLPGILV